MCAVGMIRKLISGSLCTRHVALVRNQGLVALSIRVLFQKATTLSLNESDPFTHFGMCVWVYVYVYNFKNVYGPESLVRGDLAGTFHPV